MTTVADTTAITSERRQIGRGIPLDPDEPRTLAELFIHAVSQHDRQDALTYKREGEWRHISSRTLVKRVGHIALGLHSLGLRKGDRVAILASNSPEWTLADAGCQFAGILDVPIYPTLAPGSVRYILDDSAARLLIIEDRKAYERIRASIDGCVTLERIVFFEAGSAADIDSMSFDELEGRGSELAESEPELLDRLTNATGPADIATIIYTSGTTGEPKGVMLTHINILSNVFDAGEKYDFSDDDVSLSVLPLCHIFERTGMYLYIYNGIAVNYAESIEKVPENLQEVRPTIFIGVPRIFEKVYARARLKAARSSKLRENIFDWAINIATDLARRLEAGRAIPRSLSIKHSIADALVYHKLRAFFGGRLRACITGGAALSDDIYLIFTGAGIKIFQGYGLTETSPVISSNNPFSGRLGTVGKPIRNVEVRIADDGEIEARGPGVMLGYYNKPVATKQAFTPDGWFRTGDIGEIDEDGFLRITDRKKELFKTSGGKYIAPSRIEQMMRASKFISQAVLIGDGRKFPAALIVPNFEMLESYAEHKELDLKTPAEFCESPQIIHLIERQIAAHTTELSQYEKVKRFALLENEMTVDGGELTPTLKVRRRVVDEKYKAVIDKIYDEAERSGPPTELTVSGSERDSVDPL
jgi:long-chain acyl-CoA synthetase